MDGRRGREYWCGCHDIRTASGSRSCSCGLDIGSRKGNYIQNLHHLYTHGQHINHDIKIMSCSKTWYFPLKNYFSTGIMWKPHGYSSYHFDRNNGPLTNQNSRISLCTESVIGSISERHIMTKSYPNQPSYRTETHRPIRMKMLNTIILLKFPTVFNH